MLWPNSNKADLTLIDRAIKRHFGSITPLLTVRPFPLKLRHDNLGVSPILTTRPDRQKVLLIYTPYFSLSKGEVDFLFLEPFLEPFFDTPSRAQVLLTPRLVLRTPMLLLYLAVRLAFSVITVSTLIVQPKTYRGQDN